MFLSAVLNGMRGVVVELLVPHPLEVLVEGCVVVGLDDQEEDEELNLEEEEEENEDEDREEEKPDDRLPPPPKLPPLEPRAQPASDANSSRMAIKERLRVKRCIFSAPNEEQSRWLERAR